jgi:transposase
LDTNFWDFMKHDNHFKLAAIRRYLRGGIVYRDLANELGISKSALQRWVAWHQAHGSAPETARDQPYSVEFKVAALRYMWENQLSYSQVAVLFKIPNHTILSIWARLYRNEGVAALMERDRKVDKRMTIPTAKPEAPTKDAERTQEQLIAENAQLRMENAYLKKLQALVASQGSKASAKKPK